MPAPAPLAAQLGPLVEKFRELAHGRTSGSATASSTTCKANWKLIIQNYNECLHCPNLHPALNKLSHYLSGENEPLRPTYMGGRMDLRPGVRRCRWTARARGRFSRDSRPRTRGASITTASSRT